jgi:energy-coupling factor transport system permease protein
MLRRIPIGQYIPGNSVLHRLDPRTKIVITIVYIVVLFAANNPAGYIWMGLFTLSVVLMSKLPLGQLVKSLRPVIVIIVLTVVLHFFMTPGEPLYTIGPLTISAQGFRFGLLMATRLFLLVLTSSLLTLTMSPIDLTDGLEHLLNPFRRVGVPAHELAMMITIALRFIPTLVEEADKIMKAQMARGADFETGNLLQRARAMIPLLVPLFVSAFRRADELALAMEARCYRGGEGRSHCKQLQVSGRDYAAWAYALVMVLGIIYSRFGSFAVLPWLRG